MKLTNEDIEQLLIDKYKDLLFQEALKEEEARIKEAQIKEREAKRNRIFPKSLTPLLASKVDRLQEEIIN